MIDDRIKILDLINLRLVESIADIDVSENMRKFRVSCIVNQVLIEFMDWYMLPISRIYAVNGALECLRNGVGNGISPKGVSYNVITIINESSAENYYEIITHEKKMLIKAAHEEIEMVRRLLEDNIHKYENINNGVEEMDIYALDQACADIDKTIGYIRKIMIMIPSIAEKKMKIR